MDLMILYCDLNHCHRLNVEIQQRHIPLPHRVVFSNFQSFRLDSRNHGTLNPKPMQEHHDQVLLLLMINVARFASGPKYLLKLIVGLKQKDFVN